jgi:RNA polymerase-binding transcription factor DksA
LTKLTEQQIAELARQLDDREAELASDLRTANEETAQAPPHTSLSATGAPGDPGDMGDQGEQTIREAVRHAEKERDQQELRQIDDARARMRAGSYGECIDCGADIALERLWALPFAERCIDCQTVHERDHPIDVKISLAP